MDYGLINAKGNVLLQNTRLRFYDGGLSNYIGLRAANSVTTTEFTLPAADGTSRQLMFTNGSATLGFLTLIASDIPTLTAAKISDFDTQVRTNRLDQLAAPTTSVSFNGQRITSVADPSAAQDVATKAYVDSVGAGLDPKASCRVATTANITLSGLQTIDGVSVGVNDRVLVKNQSTASQNGPYNASAGSWTRTTDADTSAEVTAGMFTFIEEGSTNAGTGWVLTTANPITLGTTALTFTQFSGGGSIAAGNGLTQVGNTVDVVGTTNRISVSADAIDISTAYVGQTSITTLGTVTTGTWAATAIAVANGGTGASTASGARTNLGVPGVFRTTFTNASLSAGSLTLTHNLGQQIVKVVIADNNNKEIIPDDVTFSSSTVSTVSIVSYGSITGTWSALVIG